MYVFGGTTAMKPFVTVCLAVVFAAFGWAQQTAGPHYGQHFQTRSAPYSSNGVYGSLGVVTPGTGFPPPPPANRFTITDPTFASRLGTTVSGLTDGRGYRRFRHAPGTFAYGYPVYVGGFGDYGYGYPQDQQPNITIVNPPPQMPQVVINQNFVPDRVTPMIREYGDDSSGAVHAYEAPGRNTADNPADEGTNFYLIAFKDHSIYSAYAYWVDGDTLHYVTAQRVHNQASLSLVDRELTEKLNQGRNLQVKLPD